MIDLYSEILVGLNEINRNGMQILNAFDKGQIGHHRTYQRLMDLSAHMRYLAEVVKRNDQIKDETL